MDRFMGILGVFWILAISYFFSENRKAISWRVVIWGLLAQFFLAISILKGDRLSQFLMGFSPSWQMILIFILIQFLIYKLLQAKGLWKSITLKVGPLILKGLFYGQIVYLILLTNSIGHFFDSLSTGATQLLNYSKEGSLFVFGALGSAEKMQELFGPILGDKIASFSVLFAFQILPTIIFVASLFAILYYLHLMQPIVRILGKAMQRLLNSSGAESLSVAANIFMGQTEAPLTVLPYLGKMTKSELFTIMVSGMSHVSAGILLAYAAVAGVEPKHLLASIVMVSPGCILLAKLWVPEEEKPLTAGGKLPEEVESGDKPINLVDAAARGASQGLTLAANVAAMLLAFIALIALVNGLWGGFLGILSQISLSVLGSDAWVSFLPKKLEEFLGILFSPIAFSLGVPWTEAIHLGNLLGTRIILNEFVAYAQLGPLKEILSAKSFILATYMLCGFGNISSVAIQVGGLGALIPEKRQVLASLGFKAVIVGTLTNLLAAAIVGLML